MALAQMPSTYIKTFNHYVKQFNFIGLDFFDESTSYFTKNNVKLVIYFATLFPFVYVQFSYIAKVQAEEFMEAMRVVPIDIMLFLGIVKIVVALLKRSQIRDMFVEIGELWPREDVIGEHKRVLLKNFLSRMRVPLDLFLLYAYINLVIFEALPLIISSYHMYHGENVYLFPFQPPSFLKYDNHFIYLTTYLWEFLTSIPCQMCVYLPFDLTMATMALNVSALLRLLQEDLKSSISINNLNNINMHRTDTESCELVKTIVHRHQQLLRLADKLTDIFGLVIFLHLVFASVEICFFGFLTVAYGGLAESIINLVTAMSAVFTIFLVSLSGQTLCDTSSEVADAAYESLWYASDNNVRKFMLFIIIRS